MKTANGYTKFEQLGQAWLKHTFLALTQNACGCGGCVNGGSVLGVGCSDPYTASRNSVQGGGIGGCGPKWQVNASTGVYSWPAANPSFSGTIARRLQVHTADLEPSNSTVRYFAECQYVTADDAAAGNKNNNATYREVSMSGSADNFTVALTSEGVHRERPGLRAWKNIDPTVTETDLNVPSDGLFIVSAKATNISGNISATVTDWWGESATAYGSI